MRGPSPQLIAGITPGMVLEPKCSARTCNAAPTLASRWKRARHVTNVALGVCAHSHLKLAGQLPGSWDCPTQLVIV